ncbi:hypothetical protein C7S18_12495 [Ahniella affigens]|uniref:OmpR/PhoB-type domain-containing protein n=1 Tax=Ahniella affigens TaxID=2021234 RepID=A0A2P1PT00_9GAMM|nr:winged helix-turn-helix domain-containing protein [Ahniella affigens]AVP97969.1 hypothetical protein C7S18_12495 [Ahniella affigens]
MLLSNLQRAASLADQRLQIGAFEVDLAAREVIDPSNGQVHRITDKARAVLAELILAQGQVVKREWLMDRVWAGTLPTGDVLTQAITTLRKAFRDDAENPRYIETIAKMGYRLLAEVTILDKPSRPLPSLSVVTPSAVSGTAPVGDSQARMQPDHAASIAATPESSWLARYRVPVAWAAAWLVLGLAMAAAFWAADSDRDAPVAAGNAGNDGWVENAVIIASAPAHEYMPRLSPDGTRVVYSSLAPDAHHARLILQPANVGGGRIVLTDSNDALSDNAPIWTTDGQNIAFIRRGDGPGCTLMMVSALGGVPRALGDCSQASLPFFDLSPDNRQLVMSIRSTQGREFSSLHVLDLATGRWSPIEYPVQEGDLDFEPRFSPDGQWLAFRRGLSAGDIWVVPAKGGTPRRLTRLSTDIRGLDFTPDGLGIVFSAIYPEGLGLFRVDIATGDLGLTRLEEAVFPDISAAGNMVYERSDDRTQMLALSDAPGAAPEPLPFASNAGDLLLSYSPDGKSAAFYSDRSGAFLVWLVQLASPESAEPVPTVMPMARFAPFWSADGQRILINGSGQEGFGLYEIDVARRRATKLPLPTHEYRFGQYVGDQLLIGWVGEREGELGLFVREGDGLREIAHRADVAAAWYDSLRKRIVFTKVGRFGLYATDLKFTTESMLLDALPMPKYYRRWLITQHDEFVAMDADSRGAYLYRGPMSDLSIERMLVTPLSYPDASGIAEAPDGRLVYSVSDGRGSDVGLLEKLPVFKPYHIP